MAENKIPSQAAPAAFTPPTAEQQKAIIKEVAALLMLSTTSNRVCILSSLFILQRHFGFTDKFGLAAAYDWASQAGHGSLSNASQQGQWADGKAAAKTLVASGIKF